ncbi:MAG: RDD family protein [Betaproteobacteria bacterium]
MTAAPAPGDLAGLGRRLLSLLYETLLLAALLLAGMVPLVFLIEGWDDPLKRALTQCYLVALTGLYFVWQWRRGGQTLAMKTWRIRLVTPAGNPLSTNRALRRYAYAVLSTALGGAGFVWALFDRDRQFLHDRLAGTRIIFVPATRSSSPPR